MSGAKSGISEPVMLKFSVDLLRSPTDDFWLAVTWQNTDGA
ncbi:hypothetical protein [Methylomonas koyamae]|nr:hypothetical protein [Methylomonas koyamae]